MKRKKSTLAAAGILAMAAVLRLLWLGRASYTIDEAALLQITLSYSNLAELIRSEFHRFTFLHRLPLTMVLLRIMASLSPQHVPPPEWLTRLPMALAGIAAVAAMYGIASLGERRLGLWAAFLSAVSFFGVFYSREAYDYPLLILFSALTLITALRLARHFLQTGNLTWKHAVPYAVSASFLLQSHLTGLLFLSPLTLLLLAWAARPTVIRQRALLARWLVTLGIPFLLFSPFLVKLLTGGFTVTESDIARRFSLAVFPALWGRMGWGQGPVPLLAFTTVWLAGVVHGLTHRDGVRRRLFRFAFLQMAAYFALQSWMLRVSRFEIRYYSPLFPCLILFVASGISGFQERLQHRSGHRAARVFAGAVAVALAAWSAPSLWHICRLECRGYTNYKGIARWINSHVPPGGVYSFLNVYELRGVPRTYPTPGRIATSVAYWSSKEEHLRARPVERARFLFTQIPTIYFVEIAPRDLLCPEVAEDFLPRNELFMRHVWLQDRSYDFLTRWRTHPLGNTQYNATNEHRILISYNLPEDLPELAHRCHRKVYHHYGRGWRYARDRQLNHWMVASGSAVLLLGNVSREKLPVSLQISALGQPPGTTLNVKHGAGLLLEDVALPAQPGIINIPHVELPPGESALEFVVTPPQNRAEAMIAIRQIVLQPQSD